MKSPEGKRIARTVVLEEDGLTYTFDQLGKKFGIKPGTIRSRWDRHGRGDTVSTALCVGDLEKAQGTRRERVEYPGHGLVTFTEIQRIHADLKRGFQFFRARWAAFGRPERVRPEMFTMTNDEVKDITGVSAWTSLRLRTGVSDEKYKDPNFLPDIPFNDLSHLSDKKNTGAARKGCDEWSGVKTFKVGPSFQGRYASWASCYQGGR